MCRSRKAIADYLLRVIQKEFEAQYRVLLKNSKILQKRRYKGNGDVPPEHELAPRADFELFKKTKEREAKEQVKGKTEKTKKPEQKKEPIGNKIEYKLPMETEEPEIKLTKAETKVKPQIEELPGYEIKTLEDKKLQILINLPNISQMSEIELLVSDKCIKVQPKNQAEVNIPLEYSIDKSKVAAKFNKKKKVLTVSLTIP